MNNALLSVTGSMPRRIPMLAAHFVSTHFNSSVKQVNINTMYQILSSNASRMKHFSRGTLLVACIGNTVDTMNNALLSVTGSMPRRIPMLAAHFVSTHFNSSVKQVNINPMYQILSSNASRMKPHV